MQGDPAVEVAKPQAAEVSACDSSEVVSLTAYAVPAVTDGEADPAAVGGLQMAAGEARAEEAPAEKGQPGEAPGEGVQGDVAPPADTAGAAGAAGGAGGAEEAEAIAALHRNGNSGGGAATVAHS